jgi:hypothetical protein
MNFGDAKAKSSSLTPLVSDWMQAGVNKSVIAAIAFSKKSPQLLLLFIQTPSDKMASKEKNPEELAKAQGLNHVPGGEDYERMISGMLLVLSTITSLHTSQRFLY